MKLTKTRNIFDGRVAQCFTVVNNGRKYYVRTYDEDIVDRLDCDVISCTCQDFMHRQLYLNNPRCKHIQFLLDTHAISVLDI